MQFWSEVTNFGANSTLRLQVRTMEVKPIITNRGPVAELKSLIDQLHKPVVTTWMNAKHKTEIRVRFYYGLHPFLCIGTKNKEFFSGKKFPFYVEDFIQNGSRLSFTKSVFDQIFRKTLMQLSNHLGSTAPQEIKTYLQAQLNFTLTDAKDRRTVLNTNSYISRTYLDIQTRITKVGSPIVYHHNGKK